MCEPPAALAARCFVEARALAAAGGEMAARCLREVGYMYRTAARQMLLSLAERANVAEGLAAAAAASTAAHSTAFATQWPRSADGHAVAAFAPTGGGGPSSGARLKLRGGLARARRKMHDARLLAQAAAASAGQCRVVVRLVDPQ